LSSAQEGRRAVNHRGFERLPDQHLGLRAKRAMVSMHNLLLPTGAGILPRPRETIDHRVVFVFTVDMGVSFLHVPASVKPLSSSLYPIVFHPLHFRHY
jgi:hypothetical protein